jgi:hypothetical protein
MPDYYAILWRALRKGDFQSARWRESVFDQTRQMLRNQLRNTQPPLSAADIRRHAEALESAIDTSAASWCKAQPRVQWGSACDQAASWRAAFP